MSNPQGGIGGQPTTILPGEAARIPRYPAVEQPKPPSELMHKDWVALRDTIYQSITSYGHDVSIEGAQEILVALEAAGWELRLNRKEK